MEKVVVGAIVVMATLILINRLRSIAKGGGCSCGCSGCSSASKCPSTKEKL